MAKKMRQIIKIDEEKCNGCGLCVTACMEGALQIVDGKAKLVSESYCDGLGACLGECPQDAIKIETREAEEFDEAAAMANAGHAGAGHTHSHGQDRDHGHSHSGGFVCPSAKTIDRRQDKFIDDSPVSAGDVRSELRQWPIKLYLVNPTASYFQNADLLLSADCVPFALGSFHPELLRGKTLVAGCPKFDDTQAYLEKLTEIIALNDIKSITVAIMEVPCCSGMMRLAQAAIAASGKEIPVNEVIISLDGSVKNAEKCCESINR